MWASGGWSHWGQEWQGFRMSLAHYAGNSPLCLGVRAQHLPFESTWRKCAWQWPPCPWCFCCVGLPDCKCLIGNPYTTRWWPFGFCRPPPLWNWGLPCLFAPAPLLLDLGCLRPNLADQSTRPGFSKTILSTRSKLESQVALPESIFPNTVACTCNNLGHSMYCDLYAVVFNISSRRQASLSSKLPPMII